MASLRAAPSPFPLPQWAGLSGETRKVAALGSGRRNLPPSAPCPALCRASTSWDITTSAIKDVGGRDKPGHGDHLWLQVIFGLQPSSLPRKALPNGGRGLRRVGNAYPRTAARRGRAFRGLTRSWVRGGATRS